jgi:hypothetical protein
MPYQGHEERTGMIERSVAVLAPMGSGQQPQQPAAVLDYLAEKRSFKKRGPYLFVGRLGGHGLVPPSGYTLRGTCLVASGGARPIAVPEEGGVSGMRSKIGAGIIAGLLAGAAFGVMMHGIFTPSPMGGQMSMMAMMARVVRSDDIVAGWIYLLVNSVVMGGVFGLVLGDRASTLASALAWGALYGFALWVLGGLVLMPLLLGMEVFAPLTMAPMRHGTWLSAGAHVIGGLLLGGAFALLIRRRPRDPKSPQP